MNEVCWDQSGMSNSDVLTWTRKDYGTTRLMLPGTQGPVWSSCINRVTVDLDTNQVVEDRPANLNTGRERRREFKGKARNTATTFTYHATLDTRPHHWYCTSCKHEGWLKTPNICEACKDVGTMHPVKGNDICVVHREQDGKVLSLIHI